KELRHLFDSTGDLKDRQIHGHHHPTDNRPEEHHEHGFHQFGERCYRRVYFLVIKISNFIEHGIERSRVLTHLDHLHHHRWENGLSAQGLRNSLSLFDAGDDRQYRAFDDFIASRAGSDLQTINNRDTTTHERPQRARKLRHRNFLDEGTKHWQFEDQGVH